MRTIIYTRVSTNEQAVSGLGLAAQTATAERECSLRGWEIVARLTDEGVSGSVAPEKRPGLAEALRMLRKGQADALVVAKLDRATRSVGDLCALLDSFGKTGSAFVALDLGIDTTTTMGRAMAQMASIFSEVERNLIGERTSAALQVLKAQGQRLGRPITLDDDVRVRITRERAEGRTMQSIADGLTADGVPTARGGRWYPSTIRRVLESVALDEELATARSA